MLLKDILAHFDISVELPQYLYDEHFNEVFLNGELSKEDNTYKICIKTRKEVIHTMTIDSESDYPVVVISVLPNSKRNGIRFGKSKDDLTYI